MKIFSVSSNNWIVGLLIIVFIGGYAIGYYTDKLEIKKEVRDQCNQFIYKTYLNNTINQYDPDQFLIDWNQSIQT